MVLKNVCFYNEVFEKEVGDIRIENGKFTEIGIINEPGEDKSGLIALPGFVDVHIHGCGGADACDCSENALQTMANTLAKQGVTSFCPTTMTLPVEKLEKIAATVADFRQKQTTGSKIAGINFEGPFIAMAKKGAQNGDYVVPGTEKDFDSLYNASKGLMKLITVAPEAFESDEFIKYASQKCNISVGHSCANGAECQKAVDLGVNHATHLYNAMTAMTHREPGIVGTCLDNDSVMCEIICDGAHVCPTVLRNTFKILGEDRAVVISDSMRGAGLDAGEFELGGQQVFVDENGRYARLADGTIAASISNVFNEFKNLLEFGIDFKTALKSCTINPAKSINAENEIGSVALGKQADLVFVDSQLNIKEVIINGTYA